ncbi:MAG: hypothetical protein HRU19_29280 [Pseudobacteriovorax sp.]|nr:hypothetical protein [Pseudobacteriovorax sp.]
MKSIIIAASIVQIIPHLSEKRELPKSQNSVVANNCKDLSGNWKGSCNGSAEYTMLIEQQECKYIDINKNFYLTPGDTTSESNANPFAIQVFQDSSAWKPDGSLLVVNNEQYSRFDYDIVRESVMQVLTFDIVGNSLTIKSSGKKEKIARDGGVTIEYLGSDCIYYRQ